MSIDPKFVELAADVVRIILENNFLLICIPTVGDRIAHRIVLSYLIILSQARLRVRGIEELLNAFTTEHPFFGTNLPGISIGRGFGALKGSSDPKNSEKKVGTPLLS